MAPANASSRQPRHGSTDRRLVAGLAVSLLLHALLLSLQLGQPGADLGGGAPVTVVLAPPPSLPGAVDAPSSMPPPLPPLAAASPSPAPTFAPSSNGLRLVDPIAPTPADPVVIARQPAKARLAKRNRPATPQRRVAPVPTPVIAAEARVDSEFTVPLPDVDVAPEPVFAASVQVPEPGERAAEPVQPDPEAADHTALAQAEALRTASEDEELRQAQAAASERLAAAERLESERRALERLVQQQAEQQQAVRQAEALRVEEAQRARMLAEQERKGRLARQSAEVERLAAQGQREQEELVQRQAAQRLAEDIAAREALLAERQRAEEAQRQLAEQLVQRRREDALRLAQEQAERERREEIERRRLADEGARREAEEAGRQARQQAEEAARRAAAESARLQAASPGPGGKGAAGPPGGLATGPGAGGGGGGGTFPAGEVAGSVGSRARELLRGVTIPSLEPPARPPPGPTDARRVIADGAERDVPLRLYVDSVRQKLERNAVLGGARFAAREVRIDPLVSVSLRSDGSIDDVTIVRSSGRADMDDAVRRFVRLNARYSAFPPNVAARFDVIEIRRVWAFADGLKLMEEIR